MSTLPTADELLDLLTSDDRSPVARWDELRAVLLLSVRMERDGGMEIGREVMRRIALDASAALSDVQAALSVRYEPPPSDLDPEELTDAAAQVRRLVVRQVVEVRNAIERNLARLVLDLVRDGTPLEDLEEALDVAERAMDAIEDLEEAYDGAKGLVDSLERMPEFDVLYMAPKISKSLTEASWKDRNRRAEAFKAASSAHVLIRLVNRGFPQDVELYRGVAEGTGVCDPATVKSLRSGPFRVVVQVQDTFSFMLSPSQGNPYSAQIPSPPAVPPTKFRLAVADVNDRYVLPVAPGNYTIRLAANAMPGYVLTLSLQFNQGFGDVGITVDEVRDAINNLAIQGVAAATVVVAQPVGRKTVEITCTDPVLGPEGFVAFHSPSTSWLALMEFPSLVFASGGVRATDLAQALNQASGQVTAGAETTVLLVGDYARPVGGSYSPVLFSKVSDVSCVVSGSKVVPLQHQGMNVVSVGDECWVRENGAWNRYFTVTEVGDDFFLLDGEPNSADRFTLNPHLDLSSPAGMTLEIAGRCYRFTANSWSTDSVGSRFIDLSPFTLPLAGSRMAFRVFRDRLVLESPDTTPSSYLKVLQTSLADELQLTNLEARAVAYELSGPFTATAGFRSSVVAGDEVAALNSVFEIVEVRDGSVRLGVGFPMQAQPADMVIYNASRRAYDDTLDLLDHEAPPVDQVRRRISQLRVNRDARAWSELQAFLASFVQPLQDVVVTASKFVDRPVRARATSSIVNALRRAGMSQFYDVLSKGDLSVVSTPARQTSIEGETAERSVNVARDVRRDITPLERVALTVVDQEEGRG